MGLLWKAGSTKTQKILAVIITLACIGPIVLSFTHNFVAQPNVSKLAAYISIILTILLISIIAYWYSNKLWRPSTEWYKFSKPKKAITIPAIPIVFFGLFWINTAILFPYLFTLLFGNNSFEQIWVIKDKHGSRRSCDYRLELAPNNPIFFYECISKAQYGQLPDKKIKTKAYLKKSQLGFIVRAIKLPKNPVDKIIE